AGGVLLLSGPATVHPFLERAAEHQDHGDQRHADYEHAPFADCAAGADAGREPHAGCRRQAMNLLAHVVVHDHASTEEADAGDDARDDAAHIVRFTVTDREHHDT